MKKNIFVSKSGELVVATRLDMAVALYLKSKDEKFYMCTDQTALNIKRVCFTSTEKLFKLNEARYGEKS